MNSSYLGIDFGLKKSGFASSIIEGDNDPICPASPIKVYKAPKKLNFLAEKHQLHKENYIKNLNALFEFYYLEIKRLNEKLKFEEIILGVPLYEDGNTSTLSRIVFHFADFLYEKNEFGPKIWLQSEINSSQKAKARMLNSPIFNFKINPDQIDSICAAIIIEDFLKEKKRVYYTKNIFEISNWYEWIENENN